MLDNDELAEHRQSVEGVEEHLRQYPKILRVEAGAEVPQPTAAPDP